MIISERIKTSLFFSLPGCHMEAWCFEKGMALKEKAQGGEEDDDVLNITKDRR